MIFVVNLDGCVFLFGESRVCVFIISILFGIGGDVKSNEVGIYLKGWVVWCVFFVFEKF